MSQSQLSQADLAFIRSIRKADVLQDLDGHRLDQTNGVILVTCSDGDRFYDIFVTQAKMQMVCRHSPRIHAFCWHGGGLACAPNSRINRRAGAEDVFRDQITDARDLKGIHVVALYAHAPCAAAGLANVSVEQSFSLLVGAKRAIRELNNGVQVACFFHVDYGVDERGHEVQRTYFFSREHWEKWLEERSQRAVA